MSRLVRRSYNRGNRHNDRYAQRKAFLLEVLRGYIAAHQRSPSLRDLQTLTGWGGPTLQSYLRRLEAEGLITRQTWRFRSIRFKLPR